MIIIIIDISRCEAGSWWTLCMCIVASAGVIVKKWSEQQADVSGITKQIHVNTIKIWPSCIFLLQRLLPLFGAGGRRSRGRSFATAAETARARTGTEISAKQRIRESKTPATSVKKEKKKKKKEAQLHDNSMASFCRPAGGRSVSAVGEAAS